MPWLYISTLGTPAFPLAVFTSIYVRIDNSVVLHLVFFWAGFPSV